MPVTHRIAPCLWFDSQGEEAARFYASIFPNSRIGNISRYGEAGSEIHQKPAGSVMFVEFELDGQPFAALNGGPVFQFSEAVSLMVDVENQEELDYYWEKLTEGGDPEAQQCGWLKDKYGVSWQVFPRSLTHLMSDPESEATQRAMNAMLQMKKIDIAAIQRAYSGE